MSILEKLNDINQGMTIYSINDQRFVLYGNVYSNIDTGSVIGYLKENAIAKEKQVYYTPSIEDLKGNNRFIEHIKNNIFGGMNIQIGCCYGWCTKMNGLEYHKGIEVIVAATDLVLLLGRAADIKISDGKPKYDSSKLDAFFVEEGTVLELYAGTLHFSPLQSRSNRQFTAGIILPKYTNLPLNYTPQQEGEGIMLININKWLIAHPELGTGYAGVTGDNIEIKTL